METPTRKKSRQREAILFNLLHRCDHPTANMIYMDIRKKMPNISLGTVYRNLSLLADQGDIRRLSLNGAAERFDGITDFHYHFICQKCGKISNFPSDFSKKINDEAQKDFPGVITGHDTFFYGICPDCYKDVNNPENKNTSLTGCSGYDSICQE